MITKPEIYTIDWVLTELKDWKKQAETNDDLYYIKECIIKKDYSYQAMMDAIGKFREQKHDKYNEIVFIYKEIKELIECRINKGALKGELNASISAMNLTNHYKWKQKTEAVVEHKGNVELGGVFNDMNKG